MKSILTAITILAAFALTQSFAIAQDANSAALKKFVTSDVVGIAYVDLENMDVEGSFKLLEKLGFKEGNAFENMREEIPAFNKDIKDLKEAGLSKGYALMRMSDIQSQGTSFVMPLAKGSDTQTAIRVLDRVLTRMTSGKLAGHKIESRDGALIAASTEQFERLKNETANDSADRSDMWQAIDGGSIGVIIFGDEDSRRVVEEMMPSLPGPFAKLNGELVANGTKWFGLSAKLDSNPELNFEIEAENEESAKAYEDVINNALKMAKFAPQVREVLPKSEIKFVFNAIAPKRDATRVSMSASELTKDLDRLAKVLAPQVKAVRNAAVKTTMRNSLRQQILAMLNHESARRHFPQQFSVDADGKPLLSWRVHVLPYLDANELYHQFHLDEPWDSEHNIKLAKLMPAIFYDQRTGSVGNNKKGLTVFQVPAGKDLVFDKDTKTTFPKITDGSSNTISIVVMPQNNAVEWTKPADWNVDLENLQNTSQKASE